ncbi:hypothetical protein P3S67_031771 [Capsicum chacoense]
MNTIRTQTMLPPIQLVSVMGLPAGKMPVYSTPQIPQNPNPNSWMERCLQEQSIALQVQTGHGEMMLLLQDPTVLAIFAADVMRRAMETYNQHLWISTVLQPPMHYQLLTLPFFNVPIWETPTVGPMQQPYQMGGSIHVDTAINAQLQGYRPTLPPLASAGYDAGSGNISSRRDLLLNLGTPRLLHEPRYITV